ncbi:MAG: hypothetical protein EGP82_01950 [Odoribacter splanchnicus]|nr:hypothetical protein [Odoribacter splanchnicus]
MAITTKIQVKTYLKEYIIGRFCDTNDQAVRFPDRTDIYHTIWDLLEKRPKNVSIDSGNLEIILPNRDLGKSPTVYNYLGVRSQQIIERHISAMMWAELHSLLTDNKHMLGINYIDSIHHFMRKYCIDSITEDAFLKNYYRWRENLRKKSKKSFRARV